MDDQTKGDWGDLCTRFGIDAAAIERRRNHVALGPHDDHALAETCAALKGTLRAYLMGLVHEGKGLLPGRVMESFAVLFDALAEQFEIWARAQGKDAAPLVRSLAKFI